jgi:hypothetical protein
VTTVTTATTITTVAIGAWCEFGIGGGGLTGITTSEQAHPEVRYAHQCNQDGDNGKITKQCFHH